MFDQLPDDTVPEAPEPRLIAIRFLAVFGARLVRAGTRLGGEAGAALAQALRDMVIDATVDPAH